MYQNHHHHNHHTGHNPHVHVSTPSPYVQVGSRPYYGNTYGTTYSTYGHNHHHSRRGFFAVGFLVLLPVLLLILLSTTTVGVTTATVTSAGAAGASAAGAIGFGISTLGIGALLMYGAVGLAYLYSGAKECYKGEKNVLDMLKSRIVNENQEGLSFKGVIKSMGAIIWSPFLLIGGLAGVGAKVIVNACCGSKKPCCQSESHLQMSMVESYSKLGTPQSTRDHKPSAPPMHTKGIFRQPTEASDSGYLLDSQNTFNSEYPHLSALMSGQRQ